MHGIRLQLQRTPKPSSQVVPTHGRRTTALPFSTVCGRPAAARLGLTRQEACLLHIKPRGSGLMTTNWNWLTGGVSDDMSGDGWIPAQVFAGQKLVVVGGSSGMGRQTAADVVAAGGSAVIIGQDRTKVDDTVKELAKDGPAAGITADLTDRQQVDRVRQQLADEHADATLLVNAAGLFVPKP